MTDYILVHGGNMSTDAWNSHTTGQEVHTADGKMGGRIWDPLIPDLEARGGRAWAPTLLDEHEYGLAGHVDQISDVIMSNDLSDVVLAGHSYGGMVITGAAARHPDRVKGMLYVDAALPDPGQSLFDLIAAGGEDPLRVEGLEPDPPYVEKIEFDAPAIAQLPKTYLLCTESQFTFVTRAAREKIQAGAAGKNWTYTELPCWHVPMANMPDQVAALLLAM